MGILARGIMVILGGIVGGSAGIAAAWGYAAWMAFGVESIILGAPSRACCSAR